MARASLPGRLPKIPGVELAARYRAAGQVGGDFYDCFPIADGSWLLVGDVCGRGIPAAAMTGMARHTIRAAALHTTSPAAILTDLNHVLRASGDERTRASEGSCGEASFCTVCLAVVTPTPTGARVVVTVAGHPLPLLVRSDGAVVEIGRPGTMLGALDNIDLSEETRELVAGDALVLFTDGISERRRDRHQFGDQELREILRSLAGASARELARRVEDAAIAYAPAAPDDDMAVLTISVPSTSATASRHDSST